MSMVFLRALAGTHACLEHPLAYTWEPTLHVLPRKPSLCFPTGHLLPGQGFFGNHTQGCVAAWEPRRGPGCGSGMVADTLNRVRKSPHKGVQAPQGRYIPTYQGAVGMSLAVQWLGLHASTSGGPRFDPWMGNYDPTSCEVWPK